MGTRCLTVVMDGKTEIATIYRHWDGYPSGHGASLKTYLGKKPVVNGYRGDQDRSLVINGIHRVAPLIISRLEQDGHDPSLEKIGARGMGEEYIYVISLKETSGDDPLNQGTGVLALKVFDGPMTAFGYGGEDCTNLIYDGLLDDFDPDIEEAA